PLTRSGNKSADWNFSAAIQPEIAGAALARRWGRSYTCERIWNRGALLQEQVDRIAAELGLQSRAAFWRVVALDDGGWRLDTSAAKLADAVRSRIGAGVRFETTLLPHPTLVGRVAWV